MNPERLRAHAAHRERRRRMRAFRADEVPLALPVPAPVVVPPRRVRVAAVVAVVAGHFGVRAGDLRGAGNEVPLRVAVHLARRLTASSTAGLAERLGVTEAAVGAHARRCAELMVVSDAFAREVAALEARLRGGA